MGPPLPPQGLAPSAMSPSAGPTLEISCEQSRGARPSASGISTPPLSRGPPASRRASGRVRSQWPVPLCALMSRRSRQHPLRCLQARTPRRACWARGRSELLPRGGARPPCGGCALAVPSSVRGAPVHACTHARQSLFDYGHPGRCECLVIFFRIFNFYDHIIHCWVFNINICTYFFKNYFLEQILTLEYRAGL